MKKSRRNQSADLARRRPDGVDSADLPLMSRAGTLEMPRRAWVETGFELPAAGAAIPVTHAGVGLGQIVLIPRPGSGSVRDERRLAVALADQFATALARPPAGPSPAA